MTGSLIDFSVLRGTPLTFPLGSVIKGWYAIQYVSLHISTYTYV